MRALLAAVMLCACAVAPAHARHYHHHYRHHLAQGELRHAPRREHAGWWAAHAGAENTRPRDCYGIPWCGCWLRHLFGIADRSLNLARNWAHWGERAGGPRVGAVVVWPHHVGIIRGGPDGSGRYLVQSGNDGHAVRTRYRSLAGAIAFWAQS